MSPPPDLENQITKILTTLEAGMIAAISEYGGLSYFYGDLFGQDLLGKVLNVNAAKQPAIDFTDTYLDELRRGGTTINKEWVPWFEKYSPDVNAKPLHDLIMQNLRDGKALGRWENRNGEGYRKGTVSYDIQEAMGQQYRSGASRIARTETARLQNLASLDRYEKSRVEEVTVHDGDGCATCAAVNGETWSIDDARQREIEHPHCKRYFSPIVADYPTYNRKPSPMPEDDPGSREYQGE